MDAIFKTFADPGHDPQRLYDCSVVMTTILRPSIKKAIESIFAQSQSLYRQILIGIDGPAENVELIEQICRDRPPCVVVQLFSPGYSTQSRHGGLYLPRDGGALRAILTLLAHARHIAYLDDDNWWSEDHLGALLHALIGHDYAFSLRWFVHPTTARPIMVDQWESLGPDRGIFTGGFIDPNCLMIDKMACADAVSQWMVPSVEDLGCADRSVFAVLRARYRGRSTGKPSCFYVLNEQDRQHMLRLQFFGLAYDLAAAADEAGPDRAELRRFYRDQLDQPQKTATSLTQLGLLSLAEDDLRRAADLFQLSLRLDPCQAKIHSHLITTLERLGDRAAAEAVTEQLASLLDGLGQTREAQQVRDQLQGSRASRC